MIIAMMFSGQNLVFAQKITPGNSNSDKLQIN